MYDKESVYDEKIAPLMNEIIKICKEEKLPMVAQFYLKQEREDVEHINEAMWCTTVLIPPKKEIFEEHHEHLSHVAEAMKWGKNGKPFVFATSIMRK